MVEKVLICVLAVILLFCFYHIQDLWNQLNKQRSMVKILESNIIHYTYKIHFLENILNTKSNQERSGYDKEVVEAVRYAMKKSRPDNGRCSRGL